MSAGAALASRRRPHLCGQCDLWPRDAAVPDPPLATLRPPRDPGLQGDVSCPPPTHTHACYTPAPCDDVAHKTFRCQLRLLCQTPQPGDSAADGRSLEAASPRSRPRQTHRLVRTHLSVQGRGFSCALAWGVRDAGPGRGSSLLTSSPPRGPTTLRGRASRRELGDIRPPARASLREGAGCHADGARVKVRAVGRRSRHEARPCPLGRPVREGPGPQPPHATSCHSGWFAS